MAETVLHLRPIAAADMPLLLRIYASTRAAELAAVPWDDAAKAAFVQMQFQAQHQHYQQHYAGAQFSVAEAEMYGAQDGQGRMPVGRLYVWRRPGSLHVVEITILPEFRQRGYGTQLLQALQREAAGAGSALSIHVEHGNPALALYQRLGFKKIRENGMHDLMEWRAGAEQQLTQE
jgi:ribosomal protein S18 acetylase RimI-like enzyme